jgi:tyrosine-protein phosphatase SIW14
MGEALVPPENFCMVWKGIYRSAFPTKRNLHFLRTIGIRSVLCLCPEDYPESSRAFFEANGIRLIQHGVDGNKAPDDRPGACMSPEIVALAVGDLLDEANHPVLIHCNQGKHRTGSLVGCLRKLQRWSLVAIFEEYRRFAGVKARVVDLQFIELFDTKLIPAAPTPKRPAKLNSERSLDERSSTMEGSSRTEDRHSPQLLVDVSQSPSGRGDGVTVSSDPDRAAGTEPLMSASAEKLARG